MPVVIVFTCAFAKPLTQVVETLVIFWGFSHMGPGDAADGFLIARSRRSHLATLLGTTGGKVGVSPEGKPSLFLGVERRGIYCKIPEVGS